MNEYRDYNHAWMDGWMNQITIITMYHSDTCIVLHSAYLRVYHGKGGDGGSVGCRRPGGGGGGGGGRAGIHEIVCGRSGRRLRWLSPVSEELFRGDGSALWPAEGRRTRRGSGREGAHLHGQVLGAGQVAATQVVICVSVDHQQPGPVFHLLNTIHHLGTIHTNDTKSVSGDL